MLDETDRLLRRSYNVVSNTHPVVERALSIPEWYYARSWIVAANLIGSMRYDAPIDPTRIYYVDPQQIERTVTWTSISADPKSDEHPLFRRPHYRLAGRVFGGKWDESADTVKNSTVYRSFVSHFEGGVPWEETRFYGEALAAIENGGRPWNCSSRSDLERRCERIDELYREIAREGYKTQDELYRSGDPAVSPRRTYRVIWGEIAINIGRDGEYIFLDGRNRLAIARILGLDKIPVAILVRHAEWQHLRDQVVRGEVARSDVSDTLGAHPDLAGLF